MKGVQFSAGAMMGFFCPRCHVQTGPGAHPTSYPMGAEVSFLGREADHSLPSSAEVKNAWIYTSTPLKRFHSVVLN